MFSHKQKKRQMEWDSPWGMGFPGWHIECSAMSLAYLPQPIDIHCGGQDHVRVHHTNEIAQAEAATGKRFVRYWLHGEFLIIDKGKMAKSGEGFVTLDSVKKEGIAALAYRMFCYTAHYRSPLMFSWDGLRAASQGLANMKKLIALETRKPSAEAPAGKDAVDRLLGPFWDALCDDCNMPLAMGALWNLLHDKTVSATDKYRAIERADAVLALDLLTPDESQSVTREIDGEGVRVRLVAGSEVDIETTQRIVALVQERKDARKDKNFARADEIRMQLNGMRIEVKDLPGGIVECMMKS
jgi:cysteinyl-tRNA synthetase